MFSAISRHCLRSASAVRPALIVQSQRAFAEEAAAASASTSGKMIFTFGSPSEVCSPSKLICVALSSIDVIAFC